jgi:ligand-binding sensor domain-containing protein
MPFLFLLLTGILLTKLPYECEADNRTNIYSFDYYSQEDGLPNNQIQCIFQDNRGWIWLGTSQGLSRLDGYRFVNFINNPDDTASLSGRIIMVIFETSDGRLLMGTENGGLNLFNRDREVFMHPYKYHSELSTPGISVNAITEDARGNIWLRIDLNLLLIDSAGTLMRIGPVLTDNTSYESELFIRSIQQDDSGNLWIGATQGLFVYNPFTNLLASHASRLPRFCGA